MSASGAASLPAAAAALQSTGAICGTARDPNGGLVPGVNVRAGGRATVTDQDGSYCLNGLPAGAYSVTFSAPGFRNQSFRVTLDRGSNVHVDATLSVGGVYEEISVE